MSHLSPINHIVEYDGSGKPHWFCGYCNDGPKLLFNQCVCVCCDERFDVEAQSEGFDLTFGEEGSLRRIAKFNRGNGESLPKPAFIPPFPYPDEDSLVSPASPCFNSGQNIDSKVARCSPTGETDLSFSSSGDELIESYTILCDQDEVNYSSDDKHEDGIKEWSTASSDYDCSTCATTPEETGQSAENSDSDETIVEEPRSLLWTKTTFDAAINHGTDLSKFHLFTYGRGGADSRNVTSSAKQDKQSGETTSGRRRRRRSSSGQRKKPRKSSGCDDGDSDGNDGQAEDYQAQNEVRTRRRLACPCFIHELERLPGMEDCMGRGWRDFRHVK
jgi:hypothetical protein